MSSPLTKRIVLTAEPRERLYELRDAQVRGLILRVQPSGHKAWIVTWAHGTVDGFAKCTLPQNSMAGGWRIYRSACSTAVALGVAFGNWGVSL